MKAYEFPITLTENNVIQFPEPLLQKLSVNHQARCLVLIDEPIDQQMNEEDLAWEKFSEQQLLAGYSDSDSIYDNV